MKTLIIDRNKWLRGESANSYLLREDDGKMCCLGFESLRRGLSEEEITNVEAPQGVGHPEVFDGDLIYMPSNGTTRFPGQPHPTQVCQELMMVNDEELDIEEMNISESEFEEERESKITELFKQIDIAVEFID